jgi:site-specific DNA-methyltransferase (adenine-specific)
MNKIINIDCIDGFKLFKKKSVNLIITSPPYAEQRKNQYKSISEKDYPAWTVLWMREVKEIIKDEGSVFINIRPHIKNGIISDYVLRTRLALRDDGWKECEELIWIKPDSPPLGSTKRPRRAWESILWFSLSNNPYCDPKANGTVSKRIGFESTKFAQGGDSHIHAGQNNAVQGIARCKDYIEVGTGKIEKGIKHPAMFPIEIPNYLIQMCSQEGEFVVDPFCGSGTVLKSAKLLNRNYCGFDISQEYCDISKNRIK